MMTFRLDVVEGVTRESVISFVTSTCGLHCIAYEIAEKTGKPHYQGWVYTPLSQKALSDRIKRQWPAVKCEKRGRSSGHYSHAVVKDVERYVRYVLKGTAHGVADVVTMQDGPEMRIDIQASHRQYWSEGATSSKKMHIVDRCVTLFCDDEEWKDLPTWCERRDKVAKYMVNKMCDDGKTFFDTFRVRAWVNSVCCRIDQEFRSAFVDEVLQRV